MMRLRKIELPQIIEAIPIVRRELRESVCVELNSGPPWLGFAVEGIIP
jgi:hypothetical protein